MKEDKVQQALRAWEDAAKVAGELDNAVFHEMCKRGYTPRYYALQDALKEANRRAGVKRAALTRLGITV